MRRDRMAKHRQTEGRFGDEDIARHHFERRAGRIGRVLVIAGRNDAGAFAGDCDLRRTQHMARRMKRNGDVAELDGFAVCNRLRAVGEIVAVAQPHHIEGFLRRQHRAVTGAGVIGMAVRNHGALDGPYGIDMKAAGLAAQAGGHRHQDVLWTHVGYIVRLELHSSLAEPVPSCPPACSCHPAISSPTGDSILRAICI